MADTWDDRDESGVIVLTDCGHSRTVWNYLHKDGLVELWTKRPMRPGVYRNGEFSEVKVAVMRAAPGAALYPDGDVSFFRDRWSGELWFFHETNRACLWSLMGFIVLTFWNCSAKAARSRTLNFHCLPIV